MTKEILDKLLVSDLILFLTFAGLTWIICEIDTGIEFLEKLAITVIALTILALPIIFICMVWV